MLARLHLCMLRGGGTDGGGWWVVYRVCIHQVGSFSHSLWRSVPSISLALQHAASFRNAEDTQPMQDRCATLSASRHARRRLHVHRVRKRFPPTPKRNETTRQQQRARKRTRENVTVCQREPPNIPQTTHTIITQHKP